MIEDLLATGRGKRLASLPLFASGGAVTGLSLETLAGRCASDGEEAVARAYLGAEELPLWRRFSLPKRRLEWLGGRIVAKEAAFRWAGLSECERDWRHWQVVGRPSGRPELVAGGSPRPEIAISHSRGVAVAMAMDRRCGIDIQERREAVARVKSRFCSGAEAARLAASLGALDQVARLTLLWAAKEAVRKTVSLNPLPGFDEMECAAVAGDPFGALTLDCRFRRGEAKLRFEVGAVFEKGYALAVTGMTVD